MEPFEVIGATAALAQLIQLCIKSGNQAHRLVESFINAPKELAQLSRKLDQLRLLLQHIQDLHRDLTNAHAEYLLPDTHKDLIHGCLEVNVVALENLQTLQNAQKPTSNYSNVKNSFRWAAIEKRKSHAIIEELKGSETSLDVVLSLLSVRIASLNRASIAALRLSQESFYSEMTNSVEEIKLCFRAQTSVTSSEETSASIRHAMEKLQDEQRADCIETKHLLSSIVQSQNQSQITVSEFNESHKETLGELSSLRQEIQSHLSGLKYITPLPEMQTTHRKRTIKIPRQPLNPSGVPTRFKKHEMGPGFKTMMQERKSEHDWKKIICKHSYTCGSDDKSQPGHSFKPGLVLSTGLMVTRNSWKAHATLRARLYLLGQRLVYFEIKARHFARAWMSIPLLNCSMTTMHVRSSEDPIFSACHDWDLSTVRYLIETGQASVHDMDHDMRANLLQHAMDKFVSRYGPKVFRGHRVIQYLLENGCSPNIFESDKWYSSPAILSAFRMGLVDVVSMFLHHGAELDSFTENPVSCLGYRQVGFFKWKMNLLRSTGFSDWNPLGQPSHLLTGAVQANDLKELLFGLEVVKMDLTMQATGGSALGITASFNNVCFAGILTAAGAPIGWIGGNETFFYPLGRGLRRNSNYEMGHWLLFSGADTSRLDNFSGNAWYSIWEGTAIRHGNVPIHFIQMEGIMSHLLLHGSNPHDTFISSNLPFMAISDSGIKPWYDHFGQIKTPEIARRCAYESPALNDLNEPCPDLTATYEINERERTPAFFASWTSSGIISWSDVWSNESSSDAGAQPPLEASNLENMDSYEFGNCQSISSEDSEYNDGEKLREEDVYVEDEKERWILRYAEYWDTFKQTTLFYDTIATPEGRRQLSRFPLVRLLVNALQLAGYRAEMDDDGDVWYDDEDGDQYIDAREFQPDEDADDGFGVNCPICQNPEKYGLGYVVAEAERGKQLLREYRKKRREENRRFF